MSSTWFITGASRGLGATLARELLAAGHNVVATGRNLEQLWEALGPDGAQLLSVELDVANPEQARAAVALAVARFGAIDVLVNNAGYGQMGFFEETGAAEQRAQFDTNVFGMFNVTQALLPGMRAARRGRIFNLSSLGGLLGAELASLYCASKFAVEGFSESLAKEVARFGIFVTLIEPGPFRTEFLSAESMRFGPGTLEDYRERRAELVASFEARNGRQPGDPARLARAMLALAAEAQPPLRFLAGAIAVQAAEGKLAAMRAEIERWRALSLGTDGDYDSSSVGGLLDQLK
jgi:NAD(P)-dependent dehydrogenase (short-subunit alcohol dehydrogenase family)